MKNSIRALTAKEILYPESDGVPMGETELHFMNLSYVVDALRNAFQEHPNVLVEGNMFVYFEEGNRHRHVSPDIFVVHGVPKELPTPRERYLVWEEGKMVDVVIEIASASTVEDDLGRKMELYRELGVQEYILFDPHEGVLTPSLQGFTLVNGEYEPVPIVDGTLTSAFLDLHLVVRERILRIVNPHTGKMVPLGFESEQLRRLAEQQRDQAERELAEERWQREQAEQQRDQAEQQREEAERQREEAEQQRGEERRQREALEAELARLKEEQSRRDEGLE